MTDQEIEKVTDVCRKLREQTQKETAKEILQIVREVQRGENGMHYRNPDCVIASRIKEKYGIEE